MKKIALVGGYLIDGTGREPLVNSLVLVEGKKMPDLPSKSLLNMNRSILMAKLSCQDLLIRTCTFPAT